MAVLHIHAIHQKRNPLTPRLQGRQLQFGKTLQHALQDDTRELDHLQKRMGECADLDQAPEKIESQPFGRRAVDGERTAELLRLPVQRVEVAVAERLWKTRGGEHSTRHVQLLYRAPKLFRRFLDILKRQNRHGSKPPIELD